MSATPTMFLIDWILKNDSFLRIKYGHVKKHKLFITSLTTIFWVKSAWPGKPILFISLLVMGGLRTIPADPASIKYTEF